MILIGYGTYVRPEGCFPAQPINPVDAAYFQTKIVTLIERIVARGAKPPRVVLQISVK